MDVRTSMKVISPVVGFFENYGYMSESVLKLLITVVIYWIRALEFLRAMVIYL